MKFPIQSRNVVSTPSLITYPGWSHFQVAGGSVVFPQGGYIHFITASAIGISSSQENLVVFVPSNSRPYSLHPFWFAPVPNFYIIRLHGVAGQDLLNILLEEAHESQSMSTIQTTTIAVGIQDEIRQVSRIETYQIETEEQRQATATTIITKWSNREYVVVPVTEGQKLYDNSGSFLVEILVGYIPNGTNSNPFVNYSYYFDTLTYLKRMAMGDVLLDVPESLNWNRDFLWQSFQNNNGDILPFKINYLLPNSRNSLRPIEYLQFTGGYQNVELTTNYRQMGSYIIPQNIMLLYRDSYQAESASSSNANNPIVLEISSNQNRNVIAESRIFPIGVIRFNDLNVNDVPSLTNLYIDEHRFRFPFDEDIYEKIEVKLGGLISTRITLIESLRESLPAQSQYQVSVDPNQLVLLYEILKLILPNDRSNYFNAERLAFVRSVERANQDIYDIVSELNELCLQSNKFLYHIYFYSNERKFSLREMVIALLETQPEGEDAISLSSKNLFNDRQVFGNGIKGSDYWKLAQRTTSVVNAIYREIARAIANDFKNMYREIQGSSFNHLNYQEVLQRRYSPEICNQLRVNFQLSRETSGPNAVPGRIVIRLSPVGGQISILEHTNRVFGLFSALISTYYNASNARNEWNNNNYILSLINGFSAVNSSLQLLYDTGGYLLGQVFSREKLAWVISETIGPELEAKRLPLLRLFERPSSSNVHFTTFGNLFSFISVIFDNAKIYYNIYQNSSNVRATTNLSRQSMVSWAAFGTSLVLSNFTFGALVVLAPILSPIVLLAGVIGFLYFQRRFERATHASLIYPPYSFNVFIAASYLGEGRHLELTSTVRRPGSRIRIENDDMVFNLSRNEWFGSINKQISIAFSYVHPITLVNFRYENPRVYSDNSNDDYFEITLKIKIITDVFYLGIIFFSPDEDQEDYDASSGDGCKIKFLPNGSHETEQFPSEGNRLTILDVRNWNRDGVDIILKWSTRHLDHSVFQKFRVIASLNDTANYYPHEGDSRSITFDQLDNCAYTTRSEFPIPH